MYITLLLYFVLGLLFLFFPRKSTPGLYQSKVERMIKEDCSSKIVKCLDDCSFLCTDANYKCVDNVCQKDPQPIDCDKEFGGVVVLSEINRVPYWECVCTNPSYYVGPQCRTKAPDVCRSGIFFYRGLDRYFCKCETDDVRLTLNHKDYCVSKAVAKFFEKT